MKTGRTTKSGLIERALRRWLTRGAVPRLPSVRVLARQFNTTATTVSATIDTLAAEGLVTVVPRSGTYATAALERIPDPSEVKPGSVERLVNKLRDRIAHGVYPSGTTLPKVAWLCRQEGVGPRTVQKACERLCEEGLICRRGRSHVVGLTPLAHDGVAPLEGGVVTVVQWAEGDWLELLTGPRTRPFAEAFMREMASRRYEIEPVVIEPADNRYGLPAGLVETAKAVRALGPRYAGSLVVARPGRGEAASHPATFYGWLGMLSTLDRPVVWFDAEGGAGEESRYGDLLRHAGVRRNFARCFIDERQAMDCALRELAFAGHRVVGYVGPPGGEGPDAARGRDLLGMGLAMQPRVVVAGTELRGWGPLFSSESPMRELRRRLSALAFPGREALSAWLADRTSPDTPLGAADSRVKALVEITQWVGPLLARRSDTTALIAPDGRRARDLCEWLTVTGIELPREMTLVAFEAASAAVYPYSVSSVDFAMDHLGYQAFHAIAGDVPVRPDASRSLAGRCRLSHRGSVASPRPYPLR
jgi:DNA-binding transcriptional regulator YhcF (GntR family)